MDEYFEQVLTSPWADGMGSIAVDAIGSLQNFQRMMSGLDSIGGTENQQLHSEAEQDAMFDISKKSLNSNGRDRPPFRQSPQSLSPIGSSWQEPTGSSARPLPVSHGTFGTLPLEAGISNEVHLGKRIRGDNHVSTSNGEQPQANEDQAQSVVTNGAVKPRVRARRGQATDPHSIAERNRRERIAERMKALQELVPDSNKTDKASMLDEIINYVKFLQMQVKCLSMCRLGGTGASAPLLVDLPAEGLGAANFIAANLAQANGVAITSQDGIAFAERQVARLMDEDMSAAMQYLQTKGLCLMPISLATAISSTGATQQVTSSKTTSTRNENGGEKEAMELQIFAARNGDNQVVHNLYEETGQEEGTNDKLTHGFTSLQSSSIGAATKEGDKA